MDLPGEAWGSVLEAIGHGISIHDCDGNIISSNTQLAQFYGLPAKSFVGRGCSEIFHEAGQTCPHEEVVKGGCGAEITVAKNDQVFRVTLNPVMDSALGIQGYVRLMTDITYEYEARKELVRSARVFAMEQMISGMAHDIGTPLGIISGYTEYLLMKAKQGEPGNKELTTILQQTKRISETVQQMLDLVRPGLGRVDAISLSGFLSEVADLTRHQLKKIPVTLGLNTDGAPPPLVYGSGPKLTQALFNLVVLAAEQIGQQGHIQMALSQGPTGQTASARVVLTGATAAGLAFDFGPTFSCITTGLASTASRNLVSSILALTRETLDTFGAEVSLSSRPGHSSELIIDLPANAPAMASASSAPQVA